MEQEPDEESEYIIVDVHGELSGSDSDISGDGDEDEVDEDESDESESSEGLSVDLEDMELSLDELQDEFKDLRNSVLALEVKLGVSTLGGKTNCKTIHQVKSSLASANGQLDDLQFDLDNLKLEDSQDKLKRKGLHSEIERLSDKIYDIFEKCEDSLKKAAEVEKGLGNECFKHGDCAKAILHYSNAISMDKSNILFYTNRALALQKTCEYEKAIQDCRKARMLDVNFLKAYVIEAKNHLALGKLFDGQKCLEDIPLAFQEAKEVVDLKFQMAAAAKERGNAEFKEGRKDPALQYYTTSINLNPDNHVLYSNRSAVYQSKAAWLEALADAERCVQICETFFKGWLHLGRCQIQLERWNEAETTVNLARMLLSPLEEYDKKVKPLLDEIMSNAVAGREGRPVLHPKTAKTTENNSARAEGLKETGNMHYKEEEYQEAIRCYNQAIALCPDESSYYGNRAAAWVMLKEHRRAAQDCLDGIAREKITGQMDKLRQRRANALVNLGQRDDAIKSLEEALQLEREEVRHMESLKVQLEKLKASRSFIQLAIESLRKDEFSRARRLFLNAQQSDGTDDPSVLVGIAKACLGLGEFEDASRYSQKAISVGGASASTEIYLVRAEALNATGCTDLALKHLTVALQMDPDNTSVQSKLKNLRRVVSDTSKMRALVNEAMNSRNFEQAIQLCAQGLQIDKSAKKLLAEFHEKRAKAYSMLAKQQLRAASSSAMGEEDTSQSRAHSSWQKCLHDAHSSLYYYNIAADTLPVILLKCEALQALDKHNEAVEELEQCFKSGPGKGNASVKSKLAEAKRLLKKSLRVDLYAILGCSRGELSSEKEIKTCYRKAALKWHPDRHSKGGEAAKHTAEKNFKEISDAYELLMDPQRKSLYDQGYDREEIEQQMEMRQSSYSRQSYRDRKSVV